MWNRSCSWVLKKIPARESAFGSLGTLIEQGLEEDVVLEGQRDVKVDAIVEEVGVVLGVQPKFSLAGTEVGFILENYDDIQDIATAVEAVVKRYSNEIGILANAISDYRQNANEDEFIQGLRTFAKYFGDKQEKDRSGNKQVAEETFGGIWIEDTEEFAKFVGSKQ